MSCGKRFTTYEIIETVPIVVVKKDGKSREVFDRDKLFNGMMRACEKRPVSIDMLDKLIDDIESIIQNSLDREVTSEKIGELVMEKLKGIDEVAYVRFASVYRQFKDINTFMDELNIGDLRLKPRYYGYANYLFSTSEVSKVQLSASTSVQNDNYEILLGGEYIIDLSNTIFDQNNIGAGIYYRSNDAIILALKYQYNNINVGLAYDVNISGLSQVSNTYGGLEIYLSYGFNRFSYNKKIRTIPCPTF